MPKISAGVLLFRRAPSGLEVLLVHPGGPLWARRDEGAWSIPKGELEPGEEPLAAAKREVAEELGLTVEGQFLSLGSIRQAGGKVVHAWALESEFDPAMLRSDRFSMEWPPRSGRNQQFPEVDRAAWFSTADAAKKLVKGQMPLIDWLRAALAATVPGA